MHLQQTKDESRVGGGPQYYFHGVSNVIKGHLRQEKACPVVLTTPYGIARSPFMAVSRDYKLGPANVPVSGSVGHDRIQQAGASESIGEAIRRWYALPKGDFETIEVEVDLHNEGHFILTPLAVKLRKRKRRVELERFERPLSLNGKHRSSLWSRHLERCRESAPGDFRWTRDEVRRIVDDHTKKGIANILEPDLLRAGGALSKLGVRLGPYLGKSYDCDPSDFTFWGSPRTIVPWKSKSDPRDSSIKCCGTSHSLEPSCCA
jgi:hypothetical protein